VTVTQVPDDIPRLEYTIDTDAVHELSNTYLGKNIIITSREDWDNEKTQRIAANLSLKVYLKK